MANLAVTILYLGVDNKYTSMIQKRMDIIYKDKNVDFSIEHYHDTQNANYLQIAKDVIEQSPDLFILDYGFKPENALKIAWILRQAQKKLQVMAFFEHQTDFKILEKSIEYGVHVAQLKSGEDILNTVYSICYHTYRDGIVEPDIAQYLMRDGLASTIKEICPITSLSKENITFETNITFVENPDPEELNDKDEMVIFDFETPFPEKLFPTTKYYITNAGQEGNFATNKNDWTEISYLYEDPIKPSTKTSKLDLANHHEEVEKREERIEETVKPEFEEWFDEEYKDASCPKFITSLIIDKDLNIFNKTDKWIEEFPCNLRILRNCSEAEYEINHFKPLIIAIQYEELPTEFEEDDGPENYNCGASLESIVDIVDEIENYSPFIIVFNCKGDSSIIQKQLDYDQIIATSAVTSLDTVLKFVSMYEQKNKAKFEALKTARIYPTIGSKNATLTLEIPIKFVLINEVAVEFLCEKYKLDVGQTYFLTQPTELYLTIVPHKPNTINSKNAKCYRAIFHSYNIDSKMEHRKFVISKSKIDGDGS